MNPARLRIVLDEELEHAEVVKLAYQQDWLLTRMISPEGDQPQENIWATPDLKTRIHEIADHKTGVNYLLLQGEQVVALEDLITDHLSHYDVAGIIERAHHPDVQGEDRLEALHHLALIKMDHGFEQVTFDLYAAALRDLDPVVRGGAVLDCAYLGWPELAEPLRPLATAKEPDASIRKDAKLLVKGLDAMKRPQPARGQKPARKAR